MSILQTKKPRPSTGSKFPTDAQLIHGDEIPSGNLNAIISHMHRVRCILCHLCPLGIGVTFNSDILGRFSQNISPCFISRSQPKRWNSSPQQKTGRFFLRLLPWGPALSPFICRTHSLAEMTKTRIETISLISTVTTTNNNKNNNNTCNSRLLRARDKDSEMSYFIPILQMRKLILRGVKSPAPITLL